MHDIRLLAARLTAITEWFRGRPDTRGLPIGYFGSDSGAAAALRVAAAPDADVAAIVSRGGRPDLAGCDLRWVHAPTLLIVGGHDFLVLQTNRIAQTRLRCPNELVTVRSASHLFQEPGALEKVAELAGDWFLRWLPAAGGEPDARRRTAPLPRPRSGGAAGTAAGRLPSS